MRLAKYVAYVTMLGMLFSVTSVDAADFSRTHRVGTSVPEPGVLMLMLVGFALLGIQASIRYRQLRRELLRP